MQCALQLIGANNSIPLQWQNFQHEFPDIKNDGEFWRIDSDQAHTAVDLCRAAGFTSGGKWRILLLHSALFVAGAVVCLASGVVKVLWKGIAAVTRRNIWPMFVQMRVFMPAGFALIAAAGIGRRLLEYGAEHYGIREVTVNEQNPKAVGFYEHMGFVTYKRTDRDEQGGPYPLLYMRRA